MVVNNRIRQFSKIFKQTNPCKYGYAITTSETHVFFVNYLVNCRAFCRCKCLGVNKLVNEINSLIAQAFYLYGV